MEPIARSHSAPRWLNRRRRYTPAVTRVEEWTSALTGVGAAMAAGNHLLKGYCALLVMAVRSNKIRRR